MDSLSIAAFFIMSIDASYLFRVLLWIASSSPWSKQVAMICSDDAIAFLQIHSCCNLNVFFLIHPFTHNPRTRIIPCHVYLDSKSSICEKLHSQCVWNVYEIIRQQLVHLTLNANCMFNVVRLGVLRN